MDKKYSNTKHRLLLVLGATGVVLGISAAAFLASMSSTPVATATDRSPVVGTTAAPSPSSSASTVEGATDIPTDTSASFRGNDLAAAEQFIENQTGIKVTLKPVPIKTPSKSTGSTGSSGSTGSTGGSTGSTGSTTPTSSVCDQSNAKVWASCTAGYSAPKIVFSSVVACKPVDRAAGDWRVTVQFALSGGHHNGVTWSLDDPVNGRTSFLVQGVTDIPAELPSSFWVTAYAKPMNGMDGSIDILEASLTPDLDLRGICN